MSQLEKQFDMSFVSFSMRILLKILGMWTNASENIVEMKLFTENPWVPVSFERLLKLVFKVFGNMFQVFEEK